MRKTLLMSAALAAMVVAAPAFAQSGTPSGTAPTTEAGGVGGAPAKPMKKHNTVAENDTVAGGIGGAPAKPAKKRGTVAENDTVAGGIGGAPAKPAKKHDTVASASDNAEH